MQILTPLWSAFLSEEFLVYSVYRQSPGNAQKPVLAALKAWKPVSWNDSSSLSSLLPSSKTTNQSSRRKKARDPSWDKKGLFCKGFPILTASGVYHSLVALLTLFLLKITSIIIEPSCSLCWIRQVNSPLHPRQYHSDLPNWEKCRILWQGVRIWGEKY